MTPVTQDVWFKQGTKIIKATYNDLAVCNSRAKINMAVIYRRIKSAAISASNRLNSSFMFHQIVLLTDITAPRRSPRA